MPHSYVAKPVAIPLQYNVPTGWNPNWSWPNAEAPHPPGYPPRGAEGPEPAVHSFIFTARQSGQSVGAKYTVRSHVNVSQSYIPPPIDGILVGWTRRTIWLLTDYTEGDENGRQYIENPAAKNYAYTFRVYVEINNHGSFAVDADVEHYKDGELVNTYSNSQNYESPEGFPSLLLESFEVAHIVISGEEAVPSSVFRA